MENLKIYDCNKRVIKIESIGDLGLLPDKSIKVLVNNSSYMTTLYVYILYKVDLYLQHKKYSNKTRVKYFNLCINNLSSLIEFEKEYLDHNMKTAVIKNERFPKNLEKIYRDSLISTCSFFSGILCTTTHWDKELILISKEDKQCLRHNYGNIISFLICSVEE